MPGMDDDQIRETFFRPFKFVRKPRQSQPHCNYAIWSCDWIRKENVHEWLDH